MGYNLAEPWARQPFDTDLRWALFQDFLALRMPRNLRELARKGSPLTWSELEAAAMEDGWHLRAKAWDQHLDRLRQQTIEHEIQESAKEVAKRHAKAAKMAVELAARELTKYLSASREGDMPGLLQPRDVIRFLSLGIRSERLVIGEATDRVDTGPDVSQLSVEELRELAKMQAKLAGG